MKFRVLALDYDGTIAKDGVLSPEVKSAIAEARARGIVVVIATGRILSELRNVAGDLNFLDAVIAENGAVLAFPGAQTRIVGQLPPQSFFDELQRRGVAFKSGQCVVEADASVAPAILATIRELQLPLVILFNRGRLMVLPQAISKGTGLRNALRMLRLSPHNAIAIGDAENDHDLLAQCELAAAVSWGSATLQAAADEVITGDGPSAVATYIRHATAQTRLAAARAGRHALTVGTDDDRRPVTPDVSGANVLIVGGSQSGKSWVSGLFCEQMIVQDYSLCVIDPEGDYGALESLPGVIVLGANTEQPPEMAEVARAIQHFDLSVVVDLSRVHLDEKVEYLKALLPMLASVRRATGLPHRIVVDEAHYFLREPNIKQLLDLQLGAYTLVTYRPSDLHPDVRSAIDVVVAKRLTDSQEVQALMAMVKNANVDPGSVAILQALATDEAVFATTRTRQLRRFKLLPRLTTHVRHREKYFDFDVVSGQEFVFTQNGKPIGSPARSLGQFAALLQGCAGETLGDHARRGDFSRWIANVFHDHRLASEVRKIEQQHRLGHLADVRQPIAALITEQYGSPADGSLAGGGLEEGEGVP